ncbi:MAG: D-hexose-6-phosphate mutarotase [Reinekea sp.]|jgi:glucose-6-phosphate 1-epimerase
MTEQFISTHVTLSTLNELDVLRISNQSATATVALQGAHLIEFTPSGGNNCLFVSSAEHFETGKAIRGGIPICWPWFGDHPSNESAPAHGFARTSLWQYEVITDSDRRTDLKFWLETTGSNEHFPCQARAELLISVGETLVMSLTTMNQGNVPFLLSQALHSYFPCQEISEVQLHGLQGAFYNNKLNGENANFPSDFRFDREIDWLLLEPGKPVGFTGLGQPNLKLTRMGSRSLVVWNPWIEKAKTLSQFHPEEYRRMFCVETTNVSEDSRLVKPGQSHVMMMELSWETSVIQ